MFVYKEVTSNVTSNELFNNFGTDFILQIKSMVSLTYDGKDFSCMVAKCNQYI